MRIPYLFGKSLSMNRILPRSISWRPQELGFSRVNLRAKVLLLFALFFIPNPGHADTYLSLTSSPERLGSIGEVLAGSAELILSHKIKKIYLNLPKLYRNKTPYDAPTLRQLPEMITFAFLDRLKSDRVKILNGEKTISTLLPPQVIGFFSAGEDRLSEKELGAFVHQQIQEKLYIHQFDGDDLGPLSKFLPAVKHLCSTSQCELLEKKDKAQETFVISIDDDHQYPSDYLDHLITEMQQGNHHTAAALAYKTGKISQWGIPNSLEGFYFPSRNASEDMIEGWGAIIYRAPLVSQALALMESLSKRSVECRLSDDLVISFALGLQFLENKPAHGKKAKVKHSSAPRETTEIGALSKGSGLEDWHNPTSWSQLKTFLSIPIIDKREYLIRISQMNKKPFHSETSPLSDVIEREPGIKTVSVLGHPKVGFVGKNYLQQLFFELDSREITHKARFEEFMSLTSLKVDGFKYMKCLYQINECARNHEAGSTRLWKTSDDIITSCTPVSSAAPIDERPIVTRLQPLISAPSPLLTALFTEDSTPAQVLPEKTPEASGFPVKKVGLGILVLGSVAFLLYRFKPQKLWS